VWAIDLPHTRPGITLDEFSRTARGGAHLFKDSPVTRASKPPAASLKTSFGVSRTVERMLE
jgi:hypothetical protein